tara:strand:- start:1694 stop:1927 length:234 start_codon:yes stop_codon:yes gene_type:complete
MGLKKQPTNSHILNPNPGPLSFTVGDWDNGDLFYAAVPVAGSKTKLAIVYQGNILKVCRNRQSALSFIDKHKSSKKK